MVRKTFVVIAILVLFLCVPMARSEQTCLYVGPDKENFRASPNGEKIGELLKGTELSVLEENGKWVKVQVTGWIYKPSLVDSLKPNSVDSGDKPVEFVKAEMKALPQDYSRGKPFNTHVRAYFQFRNNTNRTVTGVMFTATFRDSFNDVLHTSSFKSSEKIPPGQMNNMDGYWYWEDNQFIHDEVYDRLFSPASNGTIKVDVQVEKVAFSDGGFMEF